MGASEFVLSTLRSGYKLPLIATPQPRRFKNNKSALRNRDFVDAAVDELLQSGRIIKVDCPPKVVNPLSVSENGAKKHLILDLRYVNLHLWKPRVKFEDFKTLLGYRYIILLFSYLYLYILVSTWLYKQSQVILYVETHCSVTTSQDDGANNRRRPVSRARLRLQNRSSRTISLCCTPVGPHHRTPGGGSSTSHTTTSPKS